jgi:hypothetical protein
MKKIILTFVFLALLLSNCFGIMMTFDTEQKAIDALSQIDTNIGYSIQSRNARTGQLVNSYTTTWANIIKAYELDLWYFEKPGDEFMAGVTDYVEQELNDDWREPVEVL